jgi:mono/diheme cytochrome c family protein
MSLAEAKEKCAACHQPGGTGANKWNSANGTEEDWKSFAVAARAEVESNRMPPPSGLTEPDKTRLLAYLAKLSGLNPMNPTMPTTVSYDFDTAKALCIGCHDENQKKPRLDKPKHWREYKSKIRSAVRNGSMPKNKNLSEAERAALLKFIKSF